MRSSARESSLTLNPTDSGSSTSGSTVNTASPSADFKPLAAVFQTESLQSWPHAAVAYQSSSVTPIFTRTCQWAIFPFSMWPRVSTTSNQRILLSLISALAMAF